MVRENRVRLSGGYLTIIHISWCGWFSVTGRCGECGARGGIAADVGVLACVDLSCE
jgi:hypothetical protein